MYEEHPLFIKPKDEEAIIWRYMDFTKALALFENQALFFSRADKLGDPFEGSYSKANIELRPQVYDQMKGQMNNDKFTKVMSQLGAFSKEARRFTLVNCWHVNPNESAAMWKLYLQANEGIAIQSRYNKFKNSIIPEDKNKVHVGLVQYIDYEKDWMPEGNTFFPFLHKRLSFRHESELRAIIQEFPIENGQMLLNKEK